MATLQDTWQSLNTTVKLTEMLEPKPPSSACSDLAAHERREVAGFGSEAFQGPDRELQRETNAYGLFWTVALPAVPIARNRVVSPSKSSEQLQTGSGYLRGWPLVWPKGEAHSMWLLREQDRTMPSIDELTTVKLRVWSKSYLTYHSCTVEGSPARVLEPRLMTVPRSSNDGAIEAEAPRTIAMKTPVPVARAGVSKEGLRSEQTSLHIPERITPVAKLVLPRVRVPLPALQRLGLNRKA